MTLVPPWMQGSVWLPPHIDTILATYYISTGLDECLRLFDASLEDTTVVTRLIIRGGTLVTGRPTARPKRADIIAENGRISCIRQGLRHRSARILAAEGALVCPGFIDVHTHSDFAAFQEPSAQGRVFDGVTTELSGSCGFSLFPLMGRIADNRRAMLQKQGIEPRWSSATEFFDAIELVGTAINRGFFTGHGALRGAVMGYAARPARPGELGRMVRLLEECLEQGAFGLSSGLVYSPGCFATAREMIALCKVAARFGRPYVTHMRSEGRALMQSIRETIHYGRASGAPVQISHLKVSGRENWWKFERLKSAIFEARAAGIDLAGDRYPYLAAQTGLSTMFPKGLMAGGGEKALARLQHRRSRNTLLCALRKRRRDDYWEAIVLACAGSRGRQFVGMNLREIAERLRLDPPDAVVELLIRTRMNASAIFFSMSEEHLEEILGWPFIGIGSDSTARAIIGPTAEGRPHPRTFGSFGRFFSEYVFRRKLLPLPAAVAKVTSMPAQRFGLKDRGILRKGAWADIVVFDPKKFHDNAAYDNPFQLSSGMRHVIINGTPVIKDGKQTRARPGQVLRNTES